MMEEHWLDRMHRLYSQEEVKKLSNKNVLVVGLGGVGAMAAEMICRAGIGKMCIADPDDVQLSNLNRQIIALHSNLKKNKAEVLAQRLHDINPVLELKVIPEAIKDEKTTELLLDGFDYVLDAIDSLSPKLYLIKECRERNIKIVSSMGSGGKSDPMQIKIAKLPESHGCKLAFLVRKKLRKMKVDIDFPVVYSPEPVEEKAVEFGGEEGKRRSTLGTVSYMPPIFGAMCASVIIRELLAS